MSGFIDSPLIKSGDYLRTPVTYKERNCKLCANYCLCGRLRREYCVCNRVYAEQGDKPTILAELLKSNNDQFEMEPGAFNSNPNVYSVVHPNWCFCGCYKRGKCFCNLIKRQRCTQAIVKVGEPGTSDQHEAVHCRQHKDYCTHRKIPARATHPDSGCNTCCSHDGCCRSCEETSPDLVCSVCCPLDVNCKVAAFNAKQRAIREIETMKVTEEDSEKYGRVHSDWCFCGRLQNELCICNPITCKHCKGSTYKILKDTHEGKITCNPCSDSDHCKLFTIALLRNVHEKPNEKTCTNFSPEDQDYCKCEQPEVVYCMCKNCCKIIDTSVSYNCPGIVSKKNQKHVCKKCCKAIDINLLKTFSKYFNENAGKDCSWRTDEYCVCQRKYEFLNNANVFSVGNKRSQQ